MGDLDMDHPLMALQSPRPPTKDHLKPSEFEEKSQRKEDHPENVGRPGELRAPAVGVDGMEFGDALEEIE